MTAKNILVIDDDCDFAEGLAEVLRLEGHRATVAHSGEDAVSSMAETKFDVVVMDVMLPGMNGLEALSAIRERDPEAKIVMMSGYDVQHFSELAAAEGAAVTLQKPFGSKQLLRAIASR